MTTGKGSEVTARPCNSTRPTAALATFVLGVFATAMPSRRPCRSLRKIQPPSATPTGTMITGCSRIPSAVISNTSNTSDASPPAI